MPEGADKGSIVVSVGTKILLSCAPVALFLAICIALELIFPRERYPLKARFPAAIWLLVQPALFMLAALPVLSLWRHLGLGPLIDLRPLGFLAGSTVFLVLFDGLRYATHRIEHRFLWPVHAVHHSIQDLHAANSYAHPFEGIAEAVLVIIPLSFIQAEPNVMLVVGAISGFQNVIIHSPIRLDFGRFRAIFVDASYHRVHHSIEVEHHDRNFGFLFSFWDRLFGTGHPVTAMQWPATGVENLEPPRSFLALLLHPLQHLRSARASGQPQR